VTPDRTLVEAVGWVATAVFVGSYFFRRAEVLVRVQIAGALLWLAYGVLMRAPPVIAANLLVAGAAVWKARADREGPMDSGAPQRIDPGQDRTGIETPRNVAEATNRPRRPPGGSSRDGGAA
jgi:hypothetical protein